MEKKTSGIEAFRLVFGIIPDMNRKNFME